MAEEAAAAEVVEIDEILEAPARAPLHAFLRDWLPAVAGLKGAVRWQIEIDPLEI